MARHDEELRLDDWWEEPPVSRHRAGAAGFFSYCWAPLFFAALCLGLGCIGFFVPAKEGPVVGYTMGTIGVLGALACLVWAVVIYTRLIKHVDVHDGGVVWRDAGGRRRAAWEDIRDFYRTEIIVNGTVNTRRVVLRLRGKQEAAFTHALSNWKRMADRIEVETTIRQVPEARARYQAGETVRFGSQLGINQEGLVVQGKRL